LFQEGQTLYEAADYNGAINKFTEALAAVKQAGSEDFQVRGLLLYNIGKTHIKAYDIDKDLSHLRQAQAIYRQFLQEAEMESMFDQFDPRDVAEAQKELENLEALLADLETVPLESTPTPTRTPDWKKPRNFGIGFLTSGSVLLLSGVGILGFGSSLGPNAEKEVSSLDGLGLPLDHPAWAEADSYVAQETQRGRTFMAVGGSLAAVGVLGVGVGIGYLVKSSRLKRAHGAPQPSVALSPGFIGIQVSGKF
jgi:tetratricopeptide (TPR) repeat protein